MGNFYCQKRFCANIILHKSAQNVSAMFIAITMGVAGGVGAQAETLIVGEASKRSGYTYASDDRRDPFHSLLEHVQPMTRKEDASHASRLTRTNWNVLGIMSGLTGNQAVLQNAKGKKYIVSSGDVLSDENVRVVHLTNTTVTLESFAGQKIRKETFVPQIIELTFPW